MMVCAEEGKWAQHLWNSRRRMVRKSWHSVTLFLEIYSFKINMSLKRVN